MRRAGRALPLQPRRILHGRTGAARLLQGARGSTLPLPLTLRAALMTYDHIPAIYLFIH